MFLSNECTRSRQEEDSLGRHDGKVRYSPTDARGDADNAACTATERLGLVKIVHLQHNYHTIRETRSADSIYSKIADLVVNRLRADSQSHDLGRSSATDFPATP